MIATEPFIYRCRNLDVSSTSPPSQFKAMVMKLADSFFIWIGDTEVVFSSLSLSVPRSFSNDSPVACSLFHGNSTVPSSRSAPETTLTMRLSKRLACPVYLSLSISNSVLDSWDRVDRVSKTTISQELECHLLSEFRDLFDAHLDMQ
uniref:Proteasome assembly chaperone 4 n=1 Tax=Mesocestoides corti TaxID=53468 RepID=A0A5K3FEE6_MESCO